MFVCYTSSNAGDVIGLQKLTEDERAIRRMLSSADVGVTPPPHSQSRDM